MLYASPRPSIYPISNPRMCLIHLWRVISAHRCRAGLPALPCLRHPHALQRCSSSWRVALQRRRWQVSFLLLLYWLLLGSRRVALQWRWRIILLLLLSYSQRMHFNEDVDWSGFYCCCCCYLGTPLFFLLNLFLICISSFVQGPKLCHRWAHLARARQQGVHLRGEVDMIRIRK